MKNSYIFFAAPPTYAECISGSVDIRDDDDDDEMLGDTRFTPMYAYTYVQEPSACRSNQPPPAYSEVCFNN